MMQSPEKRGRERNKNGIIPAREYLMNQFKAASPFIAAFGVYLLALNSPMYEQMNRNHSVENEIKSISVLGEKNESIR